ncbi:sigma-70 family RNA polymerase sigma factor [Caulobacter sp. 1776]|uniref:RNA polymerase sigma factor n=1 Tax=Caulobacter sp. 1776 TaxID=3156420 RepID=UPI0033930BFA
MSQLRPIDTWFIEQVLPLEPVLLAAARKLVDDADTAGDLVQEAFMRVLASEGWARIEAPQPYMLRMMRNLAIERLRRARVARFDQLSQLEGFEVPDDAPDAYRVVVGRQQMAALNAALKRLPERCRRVFVMRRIEDRSPGEIARRLGVSVSTLEKRLARAHRLIAQALVPATEEVRDAPVARVEGGARPPRKAALR